MNRRRFLTLSAASATAPALQGCYNPGKDFSVDLKSGFEPSGFDKESTAEEVTAGLDLSGKNILVTGCNSGIGLETMRVLAMRGAHVIGTGRTMEKAKTACDSVDGKTTPVVMELTDFDSVVTCAESVANLGVPLDVLICNAGISGQEEKTLVDGLEKAFVVNYLGHFLFVNKLIPAVAANPCRIVHVSSSAAFTRPTEAGIRFDSLGAEDGGMEYDLWEFYGQSKLANALFSLKLAEKYAGTDITSNALHPGLVKTNIGRGLGWGMRTAFSLFGSFISKTPAQGAATSCYAAVHSNMAGVNGEFLIDSDVVTVSGKPHHLENRELADRLWTYSESLLKDYL